MEILFSRDLFILDAKAQIRKRIRQAEGVY